MTKEEIKAAIRKELHCEDAFVADVDKIGLFDKALAGMENGNPEEIQTALDAIRAEWDAWNEMQSKAIDEAYEARLLCDEEE